MIGEIKKNIKYQIFTPVEGRGNILEFLDENEDAFMEINIDEHDERFLTIYETKKHLTISLRDIEEGLEIAKRKVFNTGAEYLNQ